MAPATTCHKVKPKKSMQLAGIIRAFGVLYKALKGFIRPLIALKGPYKLYKALKGLIRLSKAS